MMLSTMKNVSIYEIPSPPLISLAYFKYKRAAVETSYPLTFIGTSYPLQRGDVIIMLPNREGEDTNLDGENDKCRETERTKDINHLKEILG